MSKSIFFSSYFFGLFIFIPFFSSSQNESIQNNETMNYHFMIHERSLKNGDTITKYIYVDCQTGEECLDSISEKSINDDFQVLKDTLIQSEQFIDPFAQTLSSASRWDQSVHDIPASTVIIDREEISENGYMTLQEILENIPGLFSIDHRSETGVTVGVRGFWSDFNKSVMIQVNGVTMLSERRNDFALFRINIPVEAIDKIEVVRGPMSVIYGAGAFFGVINIITNSKASGSNSMISNSFGSQRTLRNFVRYSAKSGAWDLSFNAMNYRRDGFSEEWNDMVSDDIYDADINDPNTTTIADYQGLSVNRERYSSTEQSFNLAMGHGGFFANINCAFSDFGFSWSYAPNFPGPKERNDFKAFTGNFQMGYGGSFKKFDYQLKATYMKSKVDMDYNFKTDDNFRLSEDRTSALRLELNTRIILLESDSKNGLKIDLLSGYYYNGNMENNSFYVTPEINRQTWYCGLAPNSIVNTHALYAQSELKKGRSKLILGLRAEREGGYDLLYHQNQNLPDSLYTKLYLESYKPSNNIFLTPRIAYIYSFLPKSNSTHYLKAMLGKAVKQANVVQNVNDVMKTYYTATGQYPDEYLKPETIWTAEIGYTLVNDSLKFELNTNIFSNQLESLITRLPTTLSDGTYVAYSSNSGQMRTFGVEVIVKKKFKININRKHPVIFKTSGSLTYQNTRLEPTDYDTAMVSFSPPILSTLKLTAKYNRLSFSVLGNFVGSMYAYYKESSVGSDGTIASAGDYIGEKTESYALFGLNVRLQNIHVLKKNKAEKNGYFFNLRCSNIFNSAYHYPTYTNTSFVDRGWLGRGRQLLLSIGYNF